MCYIREKEHKGKTYLYVERKKKKGNGYTTEHLRPATRQDIENYGTQRQKHKYGRK